MRLCLAQRCGARGPLRWPWTPGTEVTPEHPADPTARSAPAATPPALGYPRVSGCTLLDICLPQGGHGRGKKTQVRAGSVVPIPVPWLTPLPAVPVPLVFFSEQTPKPHPPCRTPYPSPQQHSPVMLAETPHTARESQPHVGVCPSVRGLVHSANEPVTWQRFAGWLTGGSSKGLLTSALPAALWQHEDGSGG